MQLGLMRVFSSLEAAAEKVLQSGAAGSGGSGAARLDGTTADGALLQDLQRCLAVYQPLHSPINAASLRRALRPSRRLAAALLNWWRRPGAQQEQQLEAAQAAAKRSCAYLRCANLGGGSGPSAKQGELEGSRRCR